MRFHFLGFLKKDDSFFEGVHLKKKKVSQNDGNGPMRPFLSSGEASFFRRRIIVMYGDAEHELAALWCYLYAC